MRETFARLHTEASAAVVENLAARGWEIRSEPAAEAHGFWATILGVALEGAQDEQFAAQRGGRRALVLNLYIDPDRQARDADA